MARTVTNAEDQLWRILSYALGSKRYCNGVPHPGFLFGLEGQVAQRVRRPLACLVACSCDVDGLRAGERRIAVSRGSSDRYVVLSVCGNSTSELGLVTSAICVLCVGGLRSDRFEPDRSAHRRAFPDSEQTTKYCMAGRSRLKAPWNKFGRLGRTYEPRK